MYEGSLFLTFVIRRLSDKWFCVSQLKTQNEIKRSLTPIKHKNSFPMVCINVKGKAINILQDII